MGVALAAAWLASPGEALGQRDTLLAAPHGTSESAPDSSVPPGTVWLEEGVPGPEALRELVSYAEPVAADPHAVRLESWRGDTISGVFLVDSDEPTARHVAFGRDASGFRYVWFSRRNPLRASLVAMYEVDGDGPPDVLYWRQIDFGAQMSRAREFRGPTAGTVVFEYSAGPPCGRGPCEGWVELPLERLRVGAAFFTPVRDLFSSAAEHGEPWLGRPRDALQPRDLSRGRPPTQAASRG